MNIPEVLRLAKADNAPPPEGADADIYRIARAVKKLYPGEVEACKALPGYTPERLTAYVMDEITRWARNNSPGLFRAVMLKRYTAGGMGAETAGYLIEGELTAARRGTFRRCREQ